ncbi:2-succinylbenzoate--CoA ligase [Spirulina subsalsa]|uniref:2-succinylbenzoate--CoA ligase n=1 Tax=Spirulina subsalsa TaxID=54311 RepID=UPI0003821651|nr:2-succinylbenzoate--CoA ligase [Spirulina subsalsa]
MDNLTTHLKNPPHWLIHPPGNLFLNHLNSYRQTLQTYPTPPRICLAESDPIKFLAAFFASLLHNAPLFLCHPQWTPQEWQSVLELTQPQIIWGISPPPPTFPPTPTPQLPPQAIMIPTGGSSGKIRFAIHTWETLTHAVEGFYHYFNQQPVCSLCLLPLYHVSGLMQGIRAFLTQGKLAIYNYSDLKKALTNNNLFAPLLSHNWQDFFISLVPTQLQFILEHNPQWLQQFKTVLVGGASTPNALLEQAYHHQINLALTYGMTETAAQIATLKPRDFLNKIWCSGQTLPHAKITLQSPQNPIIQIESSALYWGYYPHGTEQAKIFITDDLGKINPEGYLSIFGRNSQKIITGGENVFPPEIEQIIFQTNCVQDICIIGLPDAKWGEIVTAIYVPKSGDITPEIIQAKIAPLLSPFKHPKRWLVRAKIPRNAQGKINYPDLKQWATNQ